MNRGISHIILNILFIPMFLFGQESSLPTPSKAQLDWHETEFYLFIHFGPNTFTGREWGEGTEPEDIFNPTQLDCRQWARIARSAGAKGIIITAKHHDGFCLWPSNYSKHTVRESKWKNGKGDVLLELSRACKEYGLKFGVYISPWDRNHPDYGTEKYNEVFVNMMKELFTSYGPIWELWWDGANGEGPNGKRQVYDWHKFRKTVRDISPQTVIFSDVGPHIRWVGNERGIAGETNWNTLDTAGFTPGEGAPPTDTLTKGNVHGKAWIPAECDVSIRPGWFYHANEDEKVKSPETLFDLYLRSVGRGANLLLNVPPDKRGLIHELDSASLMGFKKLRDINFSRDLFKKAKVKFNPNGSSTSRQPMVLIELKKPEMINCISLQEWLVEGQKIEAFRVDIEGEEKGSMAFSSSYTTIGRKRIITFPSTMAKRIIITFTQTKGKPVIRKVSGYLIDQSSG